jgi:hypothetical protein
MYFTRAREHAGRLQLQRWSALHLPSTPSRCSVPGESPARRLNADTAAGSIEIPVVLIPDEMCAHGFAEFAEQSKTST